MKARLLKIEFNENELINGKRADQWFIENWRLLAKDISDLTPSQQKDVAKFEMLFEKVYGISSHGFLQCSNELSVFVQNLIKIARDYLHVPKASIENKYGSPIGSADKINSDSRFLINNILNLLFIDLINNGVVAQDAIFSTDLYNIDNLGFVSAQRFTRLWNGEGAPRIHEILIIETMTKYLSQMLFFGDMDAYNAFNSKLAANDVSPDLQIWSDNMVERIDYCGVYFLRDRFNEEYGSQIFYQSTRTGMNFEVDQIDAMGRKISHIIKKDSFDEGIISITNNYYYDKYGNIRIVHNDMRKDTWYMQDLKGQRKFQFQRDSPDNYYSEQNQRDGSKGTYGDFIKIMGKMYGKNALQALYLENAGMSSAEYLAHKPFDILGLRAEFRVPTEVTVPDGEISKSEIKYFNTFYRDLVPTLHYDAYGNTLDWDHYLNGIPLGTTYLQLYRDIIQGGNKYIQGPKVQDQGILDGEFSPLFDHTMQRALSRARLIAAEDGKKFDSYKGFIESFYDMVWDDDGNPVDWRACYGLSRTMAHDLVAAYGLMWGVHGAYLYSYYDANFQNKVKQWWDDLDHCTDTEITTQNGELKNNQWGAYIVKTMLEYMTNDYSEYDKKVHLLFSPDCLFGSDGIWDPSDLGTIAVEDPYTHVLYWKDPFIPAENFGEYANFDEWFDMIYYNDWLFIGLEIPEHVLPDPNWPHKDKWYVDFPNQLSLQAILQSIADHNGVSYR